MLKKSWFLRFGFFSVFWTWRPQFLSDLAKVGLVLSGRPNAIYIHLILVSGYPNSWYIASQNRPERADLRCIEIRYLSIWISKKGTIDQVPKYSEIWTFNIWFPMYPGSLWFIRLRCALVCTVTPAITKHPILLHKYRDLFMRCLNEGISNSVLAHKMTWKPPPKTHIRHQHT